jgi:putative ABC transport system permease protein
MFVPIKYNLRYLVQRRSSTLMTALTFGLVVAIFIIVMSLVRGIERALVSTGDPLNVLILRPGVQSESQSTVQIERYHIVRNYPGIARDAAGNPLVAPETFALVNKPKQPDGKPTNLQIRGVHPQAIKMRPMVRIVQGRWFRPGLREVVVSHRVVGRFQHMGLGEQVRLGRGLFTITGVFDAQGSAYDSEMWADYQELMQEFDRNAYSTVVLRTTSPAALANIKALVDADNRVKLTAKNEVEYYQEQTKTSAPLKVFGVFLAVIMSIGACFAGMNTMYANVAGRTREIGTLRILGYTPFAIMVSFLIESVALALLGGVLGCALSLPMNGIATGTTNFQSFSEIVFYFTITPDLLMKGMIFAAIMGAFGGLLPAWSASRQPIIGALRQA